jgi:hypothetical protein
MQIAESANGWKCLDLFIGSPKDKCESIITQLYRFHAQNGTLLYVGISLSAISRYSHHKLSADWWLEISSIQVTNYPSRELAEEAEQRAIISERPLYNKIHSTFGSSSDRKAARTAAHAIGRGLRWPAETQALEYQIVDLVRLRSAEKWMLIDEITEYGALNCDAPDEWLKHSHQLGLDVDSWERVEQLEPADLIQLYYDLEDAAEEWCAANPEMDWR